MTLHLLLQEAGPWCLEAGIFKGQIQPPRLLLGEQTAATGQSGHRGWGLLLVFKSPASGHMGNTGRARVGTAARTFPSGTHPPPSHFEEGHTLGPPTPSPAMFH